MPLIGAPSGISAQDELRSPAPGSSVSMQELEQQQQKLPTNNPRIAPGQGDPITPSPLPQRTSQPQEIGVIPAAGDERYFVSIAVGSQLQYCGIGLGLS